MTLGEKICRLRSQKGWSQEELAQQLEVSRQSVSKWESDQSMPGLEKVLQLSRLFDVSCDQLLKEELPVEQAAAPSDAAHEAEPRPESEFEPQSAYSDPSAPFYEKGDQKDCFLSAEEAEAFLDCKRLTAPRIALGVALCIVSPVPLFFMNAVGVLLQREDEFSLAGLALLFLMVAVAVGLFLSSRNHSAAFDYLEKDIFSLDAGLRDSLEQQQEQLRRSYNLCNLLGVCLCILSVLPLLIAAIVGERASLGDVAALFGLCLLLLMVAVAVFLFTFVGIQWESYKKLLQQEDYSVEHKEDQKDPLHNIYWSSVTAIYLLYSFITGHWGISWIIWIVATPLYKALKLFLRRKR